jgi:hypothetical protein
MQASSAMQEKPSTRGAPKTKTRGGVEGGTYTYITTMGVSDRSDRTDLLPHAVHVETHEVIALGRVSLDEDLRRRIRVGIH